MLSFPDTGSGSGGVESNKMFYYSNVSIIQYPIVLDEIVACFSVFSKYKSR